MSATALKGGRPAPAVHQAQDNDLPTFVTARELAAMLKLSSKTVYQMVEERRLPPPLRAMRRQMRWRLDDLLPFLK